MTDQTKTALSAFKEHVLSVIASTEAKRHSSAVAAIDIDRFLAAHRKEQSIKAGTWPEDAGEFGRLAVVAQNGNTGEHYSELGETVGQQKLIPISGHGGHGGLDDGNVRFLTATWHPDICKEQ